MSFESELSCGRFRIPECTACKTAQWPPGEFCSRCFGTVRLRDAGSAGTVIELGESDGGHFCLVEFDGGVRILAGTEKRPEIGQQVRISECGVRDGGYFFRVA